MKMKTAHHGTHAGLEIKFTIHHLGFRSTTDLTEHSQTQWIESHFLCSGQFAQQVVLAFFFMFIACVSQTQALGSEAFWRSDQTS